MAYSCLRPPWRSALAQASWRQRWRPCSNSRRNPSAACASRGSTPRRGLQEPRTVGGREGLGRWSSRPSTGCARHRSARPGAEPMLSGVNSRPLGAMAVPSAFSTRSASGISLVTTMSPARTASLVIQSSPTSGPAFPNDHPLDQLRGRDGDEAVDDHGGGQPIAGGHPCNPCPSPDRRRRR